ncbi:MAG: peptide chain release factor N(5)-glutamine methyltransferase [Bacilli bacterium]|nr:peptide chain release factor N(5)-glutamine methyltransferase [Bacilli bacterium]
MKPESITTTDWKILKEKYPKDLEKIIKKLNQNYPVQYLIGDVDFYDCPIKVNENVLIPRFETELLVDKLIHRLQKIKLPNPKIIDLGTGSGCIAIAIKKNIECNMTAIDISDKALCTAKENALLNHVDIHFMSTKMEEMNLEGFDIIISNPPYVAIEEPVGKETRYEPQNAIFAENQGLYFYQIILEKVSKLPTKPHLVAFEIGMNQGLQIETLKKNLLPDYQISIEKDYQNRDRFIFLERINNEHN